MTFARIAPRLRLLVSSERGMALPVALFAMIASVALASAAVIATVDAQRGSKRDSSSKSAIAAADAGVNVATMRLNREAEELETAPCLEGATPETGWCPAVTGSVGNAEYSYRVSEAGAGCGEFTLCVAVTGTAGQVSRRVLVSFSQGYGNGSLGGGEEEESSEESGGGGEGGGGEEGLIGVDDVEIDNEADARVSVGSNGDIYVHNNGNVCGNVRHGVGNEATFETNGTQCSGYEVFEEDVPVPSVSSFIPSDIATNNSNYRLEKCVSPDNPEGCQLDTYTGKWKSNIPWDPETRTISTFNNATLTLGGGDYFICKLELRNNAHLIMAEGAKVRIFFDTPENCGLFDGDRQIDVRNNADVTSTGYQPSQGDYEMPGFYLLGSSSISTVVEWKNNSSTANELVLYAPKSYVTLENNTTFVGIVVGKEVHLDNNAIVKQDAGFELPDYLDPWSEEESESTEGGEEEGELELAPVFTPQFYVECSGAATPTPDANC